MGVCCPSRHKIGRKSPNHQKLTPDLSYQKIEYSGGFKTFIRIMNDYKLLEAAWENINPVVVVYFKFLEIKNTE